LGLKEERIMISTEQVKQAIEDCKKAGHEIGIRDIAYVFLNKNFDDIRMPYRCLFGLDVDYNPDYAETYDKTGTMQYLKGYVDMNFSDGTKKKKKAVAEDEDISFEENKAYMLKLKKDIEKAIEDGEMEKKDGYKALADISVKLNDKFQVQGEVKEQLIVVNTKFNAICGSCGREIYIPTKEDLMEKYDLVERTETE
jgi:hypothetical protein